MEGRKGGPCVHVAEHASAPSVKRVGVWTEGLVAFYFLFFIFFLFCCVCVNCVWCGEAAGTRRLVNGAGRANDRKHDRGGSTPLQREDSAPSIPSPCTFPSGPDQRARQTFPRAPRHARLKASIEPSLHTQIRRHSTSIIRRLFFLFVCGCRALNCKRVGESQDLVLHRHDSFQQRHSRHSTSFDREDGCSD